jgi:uncharacterized membrane protein
MQTPELRLPTISASRCFTWLQLGWRDLRKYPGIGLAHGMAMALFSVIIFAVAHDRFWFLAGAFSGFLLVAPILATGIYAVSRAHERGQAVSVGTVTSVWRSGNLRHIRFGLLLALAGTGWVMTSAAMITLWAPVPINAPADFIKHVVLADGWLFNGWVLLGGLLAAPVFASSVIAMPMLLDRDVNVLTAVLTSWRVVMTNPIPMAIWAGVLMLLTMLGMVTAMLGLIVLMPLLGHASWHAYRDLVWDAN